VDRRHARRLSFLLRLSYTRFALAAWMITYGALRRDDEKEFLLTTRGFHWINEYPYNR
jgi:hypothetical protein